MVLRTVSDAKAMYLSKRELLMLNKTISGSNPTFDAGIK
jgi:hypothetical protein